MTGSVPYFRGARASWEGHSSLLSRFGPVSDRPDRHFLLDGRPRAGFPEKRSWQRQFEFVILVKVPTDRWSWRWNRPDDSVLTFLPGMVEGSPGPRRGGGWWGTLEGSLRYADGRRPEFRLLPRRKKRLNRRRGLWPRLVPRRGLRNSAKCWRPVDVVSETRNQRVRGRLIRSSS